MRTHLKLNREIINKYNKLYMEVADYYGLQDKVKKDKDILYFIEVHDLGYKGNYSQSNILHYIQCHYPYLSEFYKVFHRNVFNISYNDFYRINYSIEKIREINQEQDEKAIS